MRNATRENLKLQWVCSERKMTRNNHLCHLWFPQISHTAFFAMEGSDHIQIMHVETGGEWSAIVLQFSEFFTSCFGLTNNSSKRSRTQEILQNVINLRADKHVEQLHICRRSVIDPVAIPVAHWSSIKSKCSLKGDPASNGSQHNQYKDQMKNWKLS